MLNMIFVSFVISLVCLILLLSIKAWEGQTNKVLISKNVLGKSDAVLKRGILKFFNYYFHVSSKTADLPEVFQKMKAKVINDSVRLRDHVATKIIRALNINNIKDIERNKGSVSLFLKSISDDKKEKKDKNNKKL